MRSTTRIALGLTLTLTLPLPASLLGQGLTVQSISDVRVFGALGAMVSIGERLAGASMHDVASTTYLSGRKMRVDNANSAMIIDVDDGRMISIDHKKKTYTSMTFAEMAEAMQRAARSAEQSNRQAPQQQQRANKDDPKGEMKFTYKATVDRTGQRQNVAGYDAERTFVTITIEGEAKPEGEKAEQIGSLVLLSDQWMSKNAPQIQATQEFQRSYAEKVGKAFTPPAESMKAVFASDPRIKVGFEASANEMQKLQGISLRGTTYVTLVPAGMTFDRNLALNDVVVAEKNDKAEEQKSGGGFRGLVGRLKTAAENAEKKDADKAPAKQATLMTMKDEVRSITVGPVSAELFAPPSGYKEVKGFQP